MKYFELAPFDLRLTPDEVVAALEADGAFGAGGAQAADAGKSDDDTKDGDL